MYSQMYKINYMNHDATEGWEAEIIRPKGTNDYDLILFKCNVLINLRRSMSPISQCLYNLFANISSVLPGKYCRLRNDYIHFYISKDNDIFQRVNIPLNRVFYPVNADYISTIIEQVYINHQLKIHTVMRI